MLEDIATLACRQAELEQGGKAVEQPSSDPSRKAMQADLGTVLKVSRILFGGSNA